MPEQAPGQASSLILPFEGIVPTLAPGAWVAPGASVVGDVILGPDASVWYGCVLRGDVHHIRIGARSNIQDLSMLHVRSHQYGCIVGDDVTVGHNVVLHGCTIGDGCLIGMGAIILDGAEIGPRCIIAAGALVTKGSVIPEGSLVVGAPAKVVRSLTPEEMAANAKLALKYVELSRRYLDLGLQREE
jgi:carbonic anhydrase/acetyltransferase-like protein (isoleucine patch superfamily)